MVQEKIFLSIFVRIFFRIINSMKLIRIYNLINYETKKRTVTKHDKTTTTK